LHPNLFRSFFRLTRITVSLAVTFTAFAAAVIYAGVISGGILFPVGAIFLLAAGASALNQFQEAEIDAHMKRTQARPVPSGEIRPGTAFFTGAFLISAGLVYLGAAGYWTCMILGAFNIIWYNGFYS
jgi:heme o synthase